MSAGDIYGTAYIDSSVLSVSTGTTLTPHLTTGSLTTAGTIAGPMYSAPMYTPPVDPAAAEKQAALDFVLWLNGAMDVLDDTPPTQAQWDTIRGKIAEQVAAIVHQRIRKAAEGNVETELAKAQKAINQYMGQAQTSINVQKAYAAKVSSYAETAGRLGKITY